MKRLHRWFGIAVVLQRLFGPAPSPRFRPGQVHPWRVSGRTVFVGDNEFLVREAGPKDAPPVVLIHGLAGSSIAEWYRVGRILAADHRVILVDNRSHGLSPQSRTRFEVEDVADEVAAILDTLGIATATVVGYSMGGTIAQAFAYRHPGRVRSLVLIATFSHHPPLLRFLRVAGLMIARAWERITGTGTPEVRSLYLLLTGAVEREHARWLWDETHRRDPEAGAQAAFAMLRFDARDWIGRLGVSSVVVIPTRDQLVPAPWQYRLADEIAADEVVEVPGARHEVPWTHPELIAEVIARAAKQEPVGQPVSSPGPDAGRSRS
jgi:3-oxoadipate enol-lactonase